MHACSEFLNPRCCSSDFVLGGLRPSVVRCISNDLWYTLGFSVRGSRLPCVCGPIIIAVTIDTVCSSHATVVDASGTTVTPTFHEGSRPTAATVITTPVAGRPAAGAQGPSGTPTMRSGRRARRRNAPPTSMTRTAAADDSEATVEFPVTFKSADMFVVTKTKLYSTFTISMKVCN